MAGTFALGVFVLLFCGCGKRSDTTDDDFVSTLPMYNTNDVQTNGPISLQTRDDIEKQDGEDSVHVSIDEEPTEGNKK